jgi:hypothetical protein
MIPYVELLHSQKQMAHAMFCARSPQCWQRSMSHTLKSTYSALYGYQWLKDIKVKPQLNHQPLLGKCLDQILDTSVDVPKEQLGKPAFQRKPAPPATETARGETNHQQAWANTSEKVVSAPCTTKEKIESAQFSQKLESKAERQLNQVMLQQKTAKVTSLRDWMEKSRTSEQFISSALSSKPSYKDHKNARQLIKTSTSKASKGFTAQACNSSKWQQQINNNIQKIINPVLPNKVSLVSRQKQQRIRHSIFQNQTNILPLWQQTLATDNHSVRASLDTLQYQFVKNERLEKHRANSHKKTTGVVDQIIKSNMQRSAEAQDNVAPQLKRTVTPASSLTTSDTLPTTQVCPEVGMAKPEFPPVSKMINQQLQVSRRTALTGESQLLTQHEHDLDDEKLAEALKRIIDQQARRHGINV